MKKLTYLMAGLLSVALISGCSNPPVQAPLKEVKFTEVTTCCSTEKYQPVKHKEVKVAECTKAVEVMDYKGACESCHYPVVVRSSSQCCGADNKCNTK